MNGRPNADVVEDFNWTWVDHRGDVKLAAERLGMSVDSLERALHRGRKLGLHVKPFSKDWERV